MHVDTQVVSYAIKGAWKQPLEGSTISSIVANELLQIHARDPAKANIYVPLLSTAYTADPRSMELRRRDHPFNKRLADSIIMDFGNEYPSIIEYNSHSISVAINDGLHNLIAGALNHLDKDTKRILTKRFRYLVENGIRCAALTAGEVELAFTLLAKFKVNHNLKANFRNTWNDLLIMSSAVRHGEMLVTEDNLLSRFAAQQFEVEPETKHGFLVLPFTNSSTTKRKTSDESKGFINAGWRIRFSRPPPPPQTK